MHAVILYSTFSGSGKGVKVASQLSQSLTAAGIVHSIFENLWPEDLTAYDCVILSGGDGTINYYFNKYTTRCLPVILLPAGTGNDFYWTLYGNRKIAQQLADVVLFLAGNKEVVNKQVDIGRCIIDHQKIKYFNNSIGLGFDGAVLQNMKAIRYIGGHAGYMIAVIKNIFTFHEPSYTITCNGQTTEVKSTILNIANAPRTGGGFLISPHAKVDDGLLNVLFCRIPGIIDRLVVLLKVEKGNHLGHKSLTYYPTEKISILAGQQVKGQADGDIIEGSSFEISMAEWKARVVTFT